jgi:hypothetical protein
MSKDKTQVVANGATMARPLKRLCVYDGDTWVDTLRIHEVPCNGMIRYILHHIEDEDLYVFDSLDEALQVATRRVSFSGTPRVGPCPP